jgi:hypothetical protein
VYDFAVFFDQVANDGIQLMNVWADVKEILAGESVRVLVGSVRVAPERALERDCEVLAVLSVRLWLYVDVDVGHVDFCKVLAGGIDYDVNVGVMLVSRRDRVWGDEFCLLAPQIAAPGV